MISSKGLDIGSKIVAFGGIILFLIGVALLLTTFPDEDKFETKGIVTEIVDLPHSELQRITIDFAIGTTKHTKSDTTSGFRAFNHAVGDSVGLLVNSINVKEVLLLEALPSLRNSFIKTSGLGIALIIASIFMRRLIIKQ